MTPSSSIVSLQAPSESAPHDMLSIGGMRYITEHALKAAIGACSVEPLLVTLAGPDDPLLTSLGGFSVGGTRYFSLWRIEEELFWRYTRLPRPDDPARASRIVQRVGHYYARLRHEQTRSALAALFKREFGDSILRSPAARLEAKPPLSERRRQGSFTRMPAPSLTDPRRIPTQPPEKTVMRLRRRELATLRAGSQTIHRHPRQDRPVDFPSQRCRHGPKSTAGRTQGRASSRVKQTPPHPAEMPGNPPATEYSEDSGDSSEYSATQAATETQESSPIPALRVEGLLPWDLNEDGSVGPLQGVPGVPGNSGVQGVPGNPENRGFQ